VWIIDPDKLRRLQRSTRVNNKTLAECAGIDVTYLSRVRGGKNPSEEVIEALANALNVDREAICVTPDDKDVIRDPRERFLVETFRLLDETGKADLVAHASRLIGRKQNATTG